MCQVRLRLAAGGAIEMLTAAGVIVKTKLRLKKNVRLQYSGEAILERTARSPAAKRIPSGAFPPREVKPSTARAIRLYRPFAIAHRIPFLMIP
jgi:hypothetical protein